MKKHISLSVPAALRTRLEDIAKKEKRSLNQQVIFFLVQAVSRPNTHLLEGETCEP